MKKLILPCVAVLCMTFILQCRSESDPDEQPHFSESRRELPTDALRGDTLLIQENYPDPPVRDGQDWLLKDPKLRTKNLHSTKN